MANPATAFTQRERDAFPYDNTSTLPPVGQPGQDPNGIGALQQQVIQKILSTLSEPKPERTWGDRLTTYGIMTGAPTRKERDWSERKDVAGQQMQAVNSMTGMQRTSDMQERLDISRGNLNARLEALDQSGQRIDLSGRRLAWQQAGYTEKLDSEFDPVSGTDRNVIYAYMRNPQTGQVEMRDKVTLGQEPVHLGMYEAAGGKPQQFPTSPMGNGQAPQAPAAAPDRPPSGNSWQDTEYKPPVAGGAPAQVPPTVGALPHLGGPLPPKQPPPGAATAFQDKLKFVQSLDGILNLHAKARRDSEQGGFGLLGPVGNVATDWLAGGQYTRGLVGDSAVFFKQKMRWAIYQYVKQQTGAQFSITEMDQYASQFPNIGDSPIRAKGLIESAARMAMSGINNARLQWGGLRQPDYTPEMQAFDDMEPTDPGFSNAPAETKSNGINEADGKTPEGIYGPHTTNVGTKKLSMPRKVYLKMMAENPQAASNFIEDGGTVED